MASDRSLALTIAAALVAVATASAKAQEPPQSTPPPHPFGQVRVGVLSFTPTIHFTNVGFDTNVFDLTGTERRRGDFTATRRPRRRDAGDHARLDARVSTTVGLVYYQKYAERARGQSARGRHGRSAAEQPLSLYGQRAIGYIEGTDRLRDRQPPAPPVAHRRPSAPASATASWSSICTAPTPASPTTPMRSSSTSASPRR